MQSRGIIIPTGPLENMARKTYSGKSHLSAGRPSPVYIFQKVRSERVMNIVIIISIRSTMALPRNQAAPIRE